MLDRQLSARLDTVCRRQRARALTDAGVWAAVAGLGAYTILELLARAAGLPPHTGWIGAAAAALATGAATFRGPFSRVEAAALADKVLGLQDRTVAAVEFSSLEHRGSALVLRLQQDAARWADRIDPRQLVPFRLPRHAVLVPLLLALALAVRAWIPPAGSEADRSSPLSAVLSEAEARSLQRTAEALLEAAAAENRPEYVQLASLLRQLLERMERGELSPDMFRQELAALEDLLNAYADPVADRADRPSQASSPVNGLQDMSGETRRQEADGAPLAGDTAAGDDAGLDVAGDPAESTGEGPAEDGGEASPPGGSAAEAEADAQGDDPASDPAGTDTAAAPDTAAPGQGDGDDSEGPAAQAGTGTGDDTGQPSDRPESEGVRVGVTGQADLSGAGVRPLETMTVPDGTQPATSSGSAFDGDFAPGEEHSVVYESVPPALRPWVQRYFEALARDGT